MSDHERVLLGVLRSKRFHDSYTPIFSGQDITIGCGDQNTIVIRQPWVSHHHCRIFTRKAYGGYMVCITDTSKNGTQFNNKRIGEKNTMVLYWGAKISIGSDAIRDEQNTAPHLLIKEASLLGGKLTVSVMSEHVGSGVQANVFLVAPKQPLRMQLVCRVTRQRTYEIEILKALKHPNILRLIDHQKIGPSTYMYTPLVIGDNLETYMERVGPQSEKTVQFIAFQLMSGTMHLHKQGVIHRDLKPDNILIGLHERAPRIVIIDFGLAIVAKKESSWSRTCGTKIYFPPEYIKDDECAEPYDEKVDCWSIGLILYYLLAGCYPHIFPSDYKESGLDIKNVWRRMAAGSFSFSRGRLHKTSQKAKEVLRGFLEKEARQRWSCHQGLQSAWISNSAKVLLADYSQVMDKFTDELFEIEKIQTGKKRATSERLLLGTKRPHPDDDPLWSKSLCRSNDYVHMTHIVDNGDADTQQMKAMSKNDTF